MRKLTPQSRTQSKHVFAPNMRMMQSDAPA